MDIRIKEILNKLTLEEKAQLCVGADFWSLFSCEEKGIGKLTVSDGPHGLRKQENKTDNLGMNESIKSVCFPAACATAASFDEELLEKMGDALGEECESENVGILLGPAVNIKRTPLCGRNFEYFSEDPYLTGKLAAAQIKGVQKHNAGASIKHFAANNQEYQRQSISAEIDERTFREIYLRGFEIAIKEAKPWTVMCSYNKINGTYASENKKLLTDILRKEWGFDGFVMSDWGAVNDRVKGLEAGLDLEMPCSGGYTTKEIVAAVENGILSEEILNHTAERILKIILKYRDAKSAASDYNKQAHHKLAADIEKECAVLLKNDGVLPLDKSERIAFIGEYAERPRYQGGGSSHINAYHITSAFEEAQKNNAETFYAKGFGVNDNLPDETLFTEAIRLAESSDKIVIFAGLPDIIESEGYDRENLRLPEVQNLLIEKISSVNKNTVVVLHNGAPIEMPWINKVNAVLEMYLGGEGVGEAAFSLLYGEANPCGRLPETFPVKLSDNPSYMNYPGNFGKVEYNEGIFVGYRYYDLKDMPVLFPFGHGLSYTTFEYGDIVLSDSEFTKNGKLTLSVDITNTGKVFGKETVQLYISDKTGAVSRPLKELKGFKKIALKPKETKTVKFEIDFDYISYYDINKKKFYAASGEYELIVARSSKEIEKTAVIRYIADEYPFFEINSHTTFGELLKDERTRGFMEEQMKSISAASASMSGEAFPREALKKMASNVPLTFLQSMFGFSPQQIDEIVIKLQGML